MQRWMVVAAMTLGVTVVTACSSDLTAPTVQPQPRSALGSGELDSYAAAPCAPGIADNLRAWRATIGEPTAIVTGASGDTSWVRVEFPAPDGYAGYYGGVVWQEYYYLSAWDYCMATRSIGMPAEG